MGVFYCHEQVNSNEFSAQRFKLAAKPSEGNHLTTTEEKGSSSVYTTRAPQHKSSEEFLGLSVSRKPAEHKQVACTLVLVYARGALERALRCQLGFGGNKV